jgi:cytochrome c5
VAHTCNPGSQEGQIIHGVPISKIPNTHKKADWVAQVIEHLPSKCEALNSDPSTEKGKEKKKKTQQDEVRGLIDKQTWSTTL